MKSNLNLDTKVQISTETMTTVIDGEAVMLSLIENSYFGLDQIGTIIWQEIQKGAKLKDIATTISSRFDHPLDRVESDLLELIEELRRNNLISVIR